jgi:hypothetical protein
MSEVTINRALFALTHAPALFNRSTISGSCIINNKVWIGLLLCHVEAASNYPAAWQLD